MHDPDRSQLLGTDRTPRFRYGERVFYEVRGFLTSTGICAGRCHQPTVAVARPPSSTTGS